MDYSQSYCFFCFRKKKQGQNLEAIEQRVLNCDAYTTFWITWKGKILKIGSGSIVGPGELMRLKDENMPAINVMSVATGWGATGQWGIVDCPHIEGSIFTLHINVIVVI